MKIFCKFFLLIFISFILSGYNFPEKLPTPFNIDTYSFNKLKFGQTSINEFAYIAPNYPKPEVQGVYTIYSEQDLNNTYKSVRIGFKNTFLDWIELDFAVPQSWNKFKQTYGRPAIVNTQYSKKYNYQDYGYFNVVTDKNNAVVFGITLYGESDFNPAIEKIISMLPDYKNFNFINSNLVPGKLMENDFNSTYTNIKSKITNQEKTENTYSLPLKYFRNNKYYTKADLVFANGVLMFINLKPKHLVIADVKNTYGQGTIENTKNKDFMLLTYPNFVIMYDKNTTIVQSVGIVGAN